jgi:archaellum component FlaD/FlaE
MRSDDGAPVLDYMTVDFRTNLVVMRWLTFLLHRMEREGIPQLFSYYQRIGWIGKDVEGKLSQIAEGTKAPPPPEDEAVVTEEDVEDHRLVLTKEPREAPKRQPSKRIPDWQLTPQDHIRSWAFIMEIKGEPVDRNLWWDLEKRIDNYEFNIEEYYRI